MKSALMERKGRILYGDGYIDFLIESRSSDTSKVLIKVHPDLRVVAHAPVSASDDEMLRIGPDGFTGRYGILKDSVKEFCHGVMLAVNLTFI